MILGCCGYALHCKIRIRLIKGTNKCLLPQVLIPAVLYNHRCGSNPMIALGDTVQHADIPLPKSSAWCPYTSLHCVNYYSFSCC